MAEVLRDGTVRQEVYGDQIVKINTGAEVSVDEKHFALRDGMHIDENALFAYLGGRRHKDAEVGISISVGVIDQRSQEIVFRIEGDWTRVTTDGKTTYAAQLEKELRAMER